MHNILFVKKMHSAPLFFFLGVLQKQLFAQIAADFLYFHILCKKAKKREVPVFN
jgi:hypothetical protein